MRKVRGSMQASCRLRQEQQSQPSHTLKSKRPLLLSQELRISSSYRVNVTEVFFHTIRVSESRDSPKAPFPAVPHDTFSHLQIHAGCAGRAPAKISRNINTSRVQVKRELPPYCLTNENIHKFTN